MFLFLERVEKDGFTMVVYRHLINHDWGRLTTGRSLYWSIRVSM